MSAADDAWSDLGGGRFDLDGSAYHGPQCTTACTAAAARCPWSRPSRWPDVSCSWCGAGPGEACTGAKRQRLATSHPSRLAVA